MFLIFIIAGLVVFAYGCRTFENRYIAKVGWLAMLAATYVGGFGLTGSHAGGASALAMWFVLPWVEILGRVRKLRFPLESKVGHRFPPPRDVFPELGELSSEVEDAGFVQAGNAGWKWEGTDYFMRLFYKEELRAQAAVSLTQQDEFAMSYVSLTSRDAEGHIWTTSNYPFSFTMKFSPDHKVNRYEEADSFEDLLNAHQEFLNSHGVEVANLAKLDPDTLSDYLALDMEHQIKHNITIGVLEPATGEDKLVRYSWRGCWFLWLQVVKDMIRV